MHVLGVKLIDDYPFYFLQGNNFLLFEWIHVGFNLRWVSIMLHCPLITFVTGLVMNSHFCRLPIRQFHGETVFYWNDGYNMSQTADARRSLCIYCKFALFYSCNGPDPVTPLLVIRR